MPDKIQKPKILKPNQIEIPLQPQLVPLGGNLQIQIQTPEGRVIIVLVQLADYNWEKNVVCVNAGQLDITEAAKKGQFGMPKGIIH